jgi:hypothetical protein
MKKKIQISTSWYFFIIVLIAYIILFFVDKTLFYSSLSFFENILLKIIPIFLIVFVLMVLTNYFITPEFIIKHTREKGIRKWFFIIIGGILSAGPIYMWYPLLADLKHKGLSYGLIACFLYNRAIKLPLIPLIVLYFGWKYVIVLTFVMIFISIIQGILVDNVMEVKTK